MAKGRVNSQSALLLTLQLVGFQKLWAYVWLMLMVAPVSIIYFPKKYILLFLS